MQELGGWALPRRLGRQLKMFGLCTDLKVEARRRKELEQDEIRMKELEEMKSVAKAEAN